jgi:hypothetical protein
MIDGSWWILHSSVSKTHIIIKKNTKSLKMEIFEDGSQYPNPKKTHIFHTKSGWNVPDLCRRLLGVAVQIHGLGPCIHRPSDPCFFLLGCLRMF